MQAMNHDFERVAKAIQYLDDHFRDQPALEDVAAEIGLSEFHFQRLFRRWAGISPKRFLQFLTAEYARDVLLGSGDVFDATYDAGLSGPGRLHDLFVNIYAATPAQVRDAGADLTVRYGVATSPFGDALIAQTERGICGLSFVEADSKHEAIDALHARWSSAALVEDNRGARAAAESVFAKTKKRGAQPITLFLHGTNFQVRVWEALLRIPFGKAATYESVATAIGAPDSSRAVGTAIGQNPIAYLIPCHRVLRKTGALGGYRWGTDRKRALLGWEAAKLAKTDRTVSTRN